MDLEDGDHYNGRLGLRVYVCRPKSECAGLGCGVGWTPALSVTHSAADAAYAAQYKCWTFIFFFFCMFLLKPQSMPCMRSYKNTFWLILYRTVSRLEGEELATRLDCAYFETSAAEDLSSVTTAFGRVLGDVLRLHDRQPTLQVHSSARTL